MAQAYLLEIPGVTADQLAAVNRELGSDAKAPGLVVHTEGPMEGGMRVVDVWESQEQFDTFARTKLAPAFQAAGVPFPADLQPKLVWEVTGLIK